MEGNTPITAQRQLAYYGDKHSEDGGNRTRDP